jgi:Transposase IS4
VSTICFNIASVVIPGSWLAVDEMMIPFQGRSPYTVKMKNKPIKEGVKI